EPPLASDPTLARVGQQRRATRSCSQQTRSTPPHRGASWQSDCSRGFQQTASRPLARTRTSPRATPQRAIPSSPQYRSHIDRHSRLPWEAYGRSCPRTRATRLPKHPALGLPHTRAKRRAIGFRSVHSCAIRRLAKRAALSLGPSCHPCLAKALRAPHQESATRPARTQLSRIQRRASTCERSAGVFPPPSPRNRSIVGRKYIKVHATTATAHTADAMMASPWLPVHRASPNTPRPLSA